MKKLLIILVCIFQPCLVSAQTLQGGVVMLNSLPKEIYGNWAVVSVLKSSNNPNLMLMPHLDYWNISRNNNVLNFENPQTGAWASVTVDSVKNNTVTFSHKSEITQSGNLTEETTETPTITIIGEEFAGTDKFVIKKYNNGVLTQTDVVEFIIKGRKI